MLKLSWMRCSSELLFDANDKFVTISLETYSLVSRMKRVAIVAAANQDIILPRIEVSVMSEGACLYIMVNIIAVVTESSARVFYNAVSLD